MDIFPNNTNSNFINNDTVIDLFASKCTLSSEISLGKIFIPHIRKLKPLLRGYIPICSSNDIFNTFKENDQSSKNILYVLLNVYKDNQNTPIFKQKEMLSRNKNINDVTVYNLLKFTFLDLSNNLSRTNNIIIYTFKIQLFSSVDIKEPGKVTINHVFTEDPNKKLSTNIIGTQVKYIS